MDKQEVWILVRGEWFVRCVAECGVLRGVFSPDRQGKDRKQGGNTKAFLCLYRTAFTRQKRGGVDLDLNSRMQNANELESLKTLFTSYSYRLATRERHNVP